MDIVASSSSSIGKTVLITTTTTSTSTSTATAATRLRWPTQRLRQRQWERQRQRQRQRWFNKKDLKRILKPQEIFFNGKKNSLFQTNEKKERKTMKWRKIKLPKRRRQRRWWKQWLRSVRWRSVCKFCSLLCFQTLRTSLSLFWVNRYTDFYDFCHFYAENFTWHFQKSNNLTQMLVFYPKFL